MWTQGGCVWCGFRRGRCSGTRECYMLWGGVCLQAGMEDDGEEVYLPPGMGLGCVLAGGCIFLPQVCVCVCGAGVQGQRLGGVAPAGSAGRGVCIGRGMALTPGCVQVGVQARGCLCVWEEELRVSLPSVMVTGCGCSWAGGVAAVGVCGHTGCDRECRCVQVLPWAPHMVTVGMGCPCPKCPCVCKELPGVSLWLLLLQWGN